MLARSGGLTRKACRLLIQLEKKGMLSLPGKPLRLLKPSILSTLFMYSFVPTREAVKAVETSSATIILNMFMVPTREAVKAVETPFKTSSFLLITESLPGKPLRLLKPWLRAEQRHRKTGVPTREAVKAVETVD